MVTVAHSGRTAQEKSLLTTIREAPTRDPMCAPHHRFRHGRPPMLDVWVSIDRHETGARYRCPCIHRGRSAFNEVVQSFGRGGGIDCGHCVCMVVAMTDAEIRYRVGGIMRQAKRIEATVFSLKDQLTLLADKAERLVMDMQSPAHSPLPGQGAEVEGAPDAR